MNKISSGTAPGYGGSMVRKPSFWERIKKDFKRNWFIYLIILTVIIWYAIFRYAPMYGASIAFKEFKPARGITGSPWVGFKHFVDFFSSYYFVRILRNTLLLSIQGLIFSFPAPIILALLLNEVRQNVYKRVVQTITYLPHFISLVVICGMIRTFVKEDGIVTYILTLFGFPNQNLLIDPGNFRPIYIISGIWQGVGWGSIIYLAALSGIDQELYEAARIDGAGRLRQTWHVTLPGLLPTIVILLILRIGDILNVGYEKVMLLYTPTIYETADVISTFVYRRGIQDASFSYATAVDLFNSVVACLLIFFANKLSKKLTENSLW